MYCVLFQLSRGIVPVLFIIVVISGKYMHVHSDVLRVCVYIMYTHWTLTNPKNVGPVPGQISEMFGSVNAYSLNGVLLNFYLVLIKVAMNIIKMGVPV